MLGMLRLAGEDVMETLVSILSPILIIILATLPTFWIIVLVSIGITFCCKIRQLCKIIDEDPECDCGQGRSYKTVIFNIPRLFFWHEPPQPLKKKAQRTKDGEAIVLANDIQNASQLRKVFNLVKKNKTSSNNPKNLAKNNGNANVYPSL